MQFARSRSRASLLFGIFLATLHIIFFLVEFFAGRFNERVNTPTQDRLPNDNVSSVDWESILSFVPPGIKSCTNLFKNIDKSAPFGKHFVHKSKFFRKLLNEEYERAKRKDDSNSWAFSEQAAVLGRLAQQAHVETVCETGFNAGHSSYAWLVTNPNITVFSFDIGQYAYSRTLAAALERHFGERFVVIWGDSTITLPVFRKTHPRVTCDVIFIDGGKTYGVVKTDFRTLLRMSHVNTIVMFNNYPSSEGNKKIGRVWEQGKRAGVVSEFFHCDYLPDHDHGFSVGKVNKYMK